MTAFAELDIEARTESLRKARADLDALTKSAMNTQDAAQDAGIAVSRAGGQMGLAGGNARMFAQQLSQVAQQGAATGQWMQAFTIQAADIGMAFGTMGTIIGTLATIAIPTLIASFTGGTTGADTFRQSLDSLEDQLSSTGELAAIAAGDFDALIERFGVLTPAVQALVATQADISLRAMADSARALSDELVALYNGNAWLNVSRAEELYNALNLAGDGSRELAAMLVQLRDAATLDEQLATVTRMRERFIEMVGPVGQMTQRQFEFYQRIVDSESALRATKLRAEELARAGSAVAQAISPIPGILNSARAAADAAAGAVANIGTAASRAVGGVQALASAMWNAAQARIAANAALESMGQGGAANLANQYALYGQGRAAANAAISSSGSLYTPFPTGGGVGGGGGGGGGGDDGFQARLDAIVSQFQAEQAVVDEWYAEAQAVLADRRSMEILGAQEHARVMLEVEQEYQRQLAEIRLNAWDSQMAEYGDFFGAMASLTQQGGDKLVKISRGFAATEAFINTLRAQAQVLADPSLGFFGKLAAYVKIGASGLGIVRALSGSGGGGGSVGNVSRAATPEPVQQQRIVRLDIQGDGIFADMLRQSGQAIVDAITNEQRFGGTTIISGRA